MTSAWSVCKNILNRNRRKRRRKKEEEKEMEEIYRGSQTRGKKREGVRKDVKREL